LALRVLGGGWLWSCGVGVGGVVSGLGFMPGGVLGFSGVLGVWGWGAA